MTTPYLKGAANTHVAFLHKHSTRNPQECKLRLKHHTCYVLHYFKLPPLQLTYFWTWFWQPYPNILFELLSNKAISSDIPDIFLTSLSDTFFLTFLPSCEQISWHSFDLSCDILQLLLWHTLSATTTNPCHHRWDPARHTALAGSRLGSSTPHCPHSIAVGVQHATLNS